MTERPKMNAYQVAEIDRIEVERIEADLRKMFGAVERVTSVTTFISNAKPDLADERDLVELEGWMILGGVFVPRYMLPADVSAVEDDGVKACRAQILNVILAAYRAGRGWRNAEVPA